MEASDESQTSPEAFFHGLTCKDFKDIRDFNGGSERLFGQGEQFGTILFNTSGVELTGASLPRTLSGINKMKGLRPVLSFDLSVCAHSRGVLSSRLRLSMLDNAIFRTRGTMVNNFVQHLRRWFV